MLFTVTSAGEATQSLLPWETRRPAVVCHSLNQIVRRPAQQGQAVMKRWVCSSKASQASGCKASRAAETAVTTGEKVH